MEFVLQRSYAATTSREPSRTAAIGAEGFGFEPPRASAHTLPPLVPGAAQFALAPGEQYAIDASAVIASHADVDHIELARLFFAAVELAQPR
jgi:glyoxylase-like metal-dependent hydrolase (beta-lactamase superfamily II)